MDSQLQTLEKKCNIYRPQALRIARKIIAKIVKLRREEKNGIEGNDNNIDEYITKQLAFLPTNTIIRTISLHKKINFDIILISPFNNEIGSVKLYGEICLKTKQIHFIVMYLSQDGTNWQGSVMQPQTLEALQWFIKRHFIILFINIFNEF